jgi:histidyl-tRNA synthetase
VELAARIRAAGHRCELYSGGGRLKLAKQLKYADRRGVRVAVIRGADERDAATVTCKSLASGEQHTVGLDMLESTVGAMLDA